MGWWISRAGRTFSNSDHYEFVKAHPRLFGMPKIVSEFGLAERTPILEEAVAKGWIRARGDRRQGLVFEVAAITPDTLFNVRDFLLKQKWDPDQKLMIEESSGATWYEPASFFMSDAALAVAKNPKRRRVSARR